MAKLSAQQMKGALPFLLHGEHTKNSTSTFSVQWKAPCWFNLLIKVKNWDNRSNEPVQVDFKGKKFAHYCGSLFAHQAKGKVKATSLQWMPIFKFFLNDFTWIQWQNCKRLFQLGTSCAGDRSATSMPQITGNRQDLYIDPNSHFSSLSQSQNLLKPPNSMKVLLNWGKTVLPCLIFWPSENWTSPGEFVGYPFTGKSLMFSRSILLCVTTALNLELLIIRFEIMLH